MKDLLQFKLLLGLINFILLTHLILLSKITTYCTLTWYLFLFESVDHANFNILNL